MLANKAHVLMSGTLEPHWEVVRVSVSVMDWVQRGFWDHLEGTSDAEVGGEGRRAS